MKRARSARSSMLAFLLLISPSFSYAWHDETHLVIAEAAGYQKWYNAAGAPIAKVKAGDKEGYNHFSDNPPDTLWDRCSKFAWARIISEVANIIFVALLCFQKAHKEIVTLDYFYARSRQL